MVVRGRVRIGKRTKDLVKELKPKEIAVIDHENLDALGACGLVDANVRAVINVAAAITGKYPNLGPQVLLDHGVLHIDNVGPGILEHVHDGDLIEIRGNGIYRQGELIASGRVLTESVVAQYMDVAGRNLEGEIGRFIDNTLQYAHHEKAEILADLNIPDLDTTIKDRHVVVVVRGLGFREDLQAVAAYIDEMHPVLIGVDGGADAIIEAGYQPDLIIGDMDSVSDTALSSGAELLVHAYRDGTCPGKKRLQTMGVKFKVLPAVGTSEDVALLLAHQLGAELIVAVGTHTNLIDFLEKGRAGMSSTLLTRMKIGPILVDAKGVSKLYQARSGQQWLLPVLIGATVPVGAFIAMSSPWRQLVRLLWLQIRMALGGIF